MTEESSIIKILLEVWIASQVHQSMSRNGSKMSAPKRKRDVEEPVVDDRGTPKPKTSKHPATPRANVTTTPSRHSRAGSGARPSSSNRVEPLSTADTGHRLSSGTVIVSATSTMPHRVMVENPCEYLCHLHVLLLCNSGSEQRSADLVPRNPHMPGGQPSTTNASDNLIASIRYMLRSIDAISDIQTSMTRLWFRMNLKLFEFRKITRFKKSKAEWKRHLGNIHRDSNSSLEECADTLMAQNELLGWQEDHDIHWNTFDYQFGKELQVLLGTRRYLLAM